MQGLAVVAAIGLLFGTTQSATAQQGTIESLAGDTMRVVVSSAAPGWQATPLSLQPGQAFNVTYVGGSWTVDYRLFPEVGPEGYAATIDGEIYQGCKLDASLPYGRLLGRIGDSQFFSIGVGGTFIAATAGTLSLRIHDHDACLADNAGEITMMLALPAKATKDDLKDIRELVNAVVDATDLVCKRLFRKFVLVEAEIAAPRVARDDRVKSSIRTWWQRA
ncbi:MAG: hypothetical protein LC799_18170 [Actinobacteria bacterium]|nr:hypothetical protein [Actinomycetota bacterium]